MFFFGKRENPNYLPITVEESDRPSVNNVYRLLFFALLAFSLPLFLFLAIDRRRVSHQWHLQTSQRMLPDIPLRLVVFNQDERFVNSMPYDKASPWRSLYPPGKGFVEISDPRRWNVSGGYPLTNGTTHNSEAYCISMFHQLHCIGSIKAALSEYRTLNRTGLGLSKSTDPEHLDHCIDYLRQAVMCAGDMTLEKAFINDGQRIEGSDGWGITHECRDWTVMYDFALAHEY